jgi:hypothetical protein
MKAIFASKLALALTISAALVGIGTGLYFGVIKNNKPPTNTETTTTSDSDFHRTGQNSFGLAVCDEMTIDEVASAINKPVLNIQDYSNSASTGCEYFVSDTGFVVIDVGYGDMANQKLGLEALDRTIKTDSRITLENMLAYSENGLMDVYINVESGQKYVRVGRSSTTAVDEETLIKLAIATEAKIISYK